MYGNTYIRYLQTIDTVVNSQLLTETGQKL